MVNPYLAGGLFVDYLIRGRFHQIIPKHPVRIGPANLAALTAPAVPKDNPRSAGFEAAGAANVHSSSTSLGVSLNSGFVESMAAHE